MISTILTKLDYHLHNLALERLLFLAKDRKGSDKNNEAMVMAAQYGKEKRSRQSWRLVLAAVAKGVAHPAAR